jgi:hypothetical protein
VPERTAEVCAPTGAIANKRMNQVLIGGVM